jgi:cbb3-type cytochrome oxidase cytochrome c subunit
MKGLAPLFLGIFGTFAFSWVGLTVIPNWQIGHLNPQSDEEGTDTYPMPQSGMAARGARVYAANGCAYCHSQQVRADYSADDIERKWGDRRSAPRDYIFERPVFLGKMRMGQDLANVGARAPKEAESAPAPTPGATGPAASPAPQPGAPAPSVAPSGASPSPAPTKVGSPPPGAPSPGATGSPPPASSPAASPAAAKPPAPNASPTTKPAGSPPAAGSPATPPSAPRPNESPASPVAAGGSPATTPAPWSEVTTGEPPMYSAAWHHAHLYSPRSINVDSVMPSYRFLYQTRRISDAPSAEALHLTGSDAPPEGWEVVPTFDARCLVAYLMSLNQSHPLKEVRTVAAPAASPAASPATAK